MTQAPKFLKIPADLLSRLKQRAFGIWRRQTARGLPIAYKMALLISLLIIIGMGTLGAVVVTNQGKLLTTQINELGFTVGSQTAESVKEMILAEDVLGISVLTKNLTNDTSILGTVIVNPEKTVLAESGVSPLKDGPGFTFSEKFFLPAEPQSFEWEWIDPVTHGIHPVTSYINPVTFKNIHVGYSIITFDRSTLEQSIYDSVRAITSATILMIILAIIISFMIGKRLSRPIQQLVHANRAIGSGDFNYRINQKRNDEIGYLIESFNNMAEGLLRKSQVEHAFSRYVSSNVAKVVLNNLEQLKLGGKRIEGTVLFADIVDYTSISSRLDPDETVALLNEYFTYINLASKLYKGHIDKFMGDCAMVVFGVPEEDKHHSFNAVMCAILFQRLVELINKQRVRDGKFPVQFRIGINTGEMLAGNMGSTERMEYTVVGDAVNLASRLCTYAAPGETVIPEELYQRDEIRDHFVAERMRPIQLRSRMEPVETYIVKDVSPEHREPLDKQLHVIFRNKEVA